MSPEVSIICPIYNQELYITECLDSILTQSFVDFELIIVDNNSTDASVDICKEYAKKDKRIILLHESKQGVSNARNTGIRAAKGKYIAFIDPDDTIEKDYLKELIENIAPGIMPVCEVRKIYKNKIEAQLICAKSNSSKYEKLETPGVEGYPVNKLYETKIIKDNNLYFDPEAYIQEDNLFNYNYVKYIKDLKIINKPLYNYRMRAGSAIRKKEDIKTLLKIENFCKKEKIPKQKIEYSIIRAYLINKNKSKDYKKRLAKFIKNPKYSAKMKIKLLARIILKLEKKPKYELYE